MNPVSELINDLAKLPLDVTFKCNNGEVKANSTMLEIRCQSLSDLVKKSANKVVDVTVGLAAMKYVIKFIHTAKIPDWSQVYELGILQDTWCFAVEHKLTLLADATENAIVDKTIYVSKAFEVLSMRPITDRMKNAAINNIFSNGKVDRRFDLADFSTELRDILLEKLLKTRMLIE